MIAYSYDSAGYYVGTCHCQIDPVKSKKAGHPIYLLPKNATWTEPPAYDPVTERARWDGTVWIVEEIPQPEPEPEEGDN